MFAVKRLLAAVTVGGAGLMFVGLIVAAVYALSVMFWSLPISLVAGWLGAHWSWWWTCTHWGLLAPLVLG